MKEKTSEEVQKYENQKKEVEQEKEKKKEKKTESGKIKVKQKMKKIYEVFFPSNLVRVI